MTATTISSRLAPLATALLALQLAACLIPKRGPSYPSASHTPATIEGRRLEVKDTKGHYASILIEADWVVEGDRSSTTGATTGTTAPTKACVRSGDVHIITPAGTMPLRRASVCVQTSPFALVGEADVAFPAFGYLKNAGVTGEASRAKIAMGLGRSLGHIELGGERMKLNPNQFYLSVEYFKGLKATIGQVELSTPSAGARLIVAPQEPMVYVSGSMTGIMDDAGFGFSADGRLPFAPKQKLYDGSGWRKQTFTGHVVAHGSMPLTPYPLSIKGRMLIDVDANNDGQTVFDGQAGDLSVAADGTLSFGYDKAGFGFSVEMAKASVAYDGHRKIASFNSESGGNLFEGTPLAFLGAARPKTTVRGFYRSPTDFEVNARLRQSMLAGFAVSDLDVTLGSKGVRARGEAVLPGIGKAMVEGSFDAKGGFNLRGRADITVAGFKMVGADVTLGTKGVRIAGTVNLPGLGNAKVSGQVQPNGKFSLTGRATLAPAGLRLANASVKIGTQGAAISGGVNFIGNRFHVSGSATPRGFSLTGSVELSAVVLFGQVRLKITNRGAGASINGQACLGACIDFPGLEINTNGTICPTFPLVGRKCIHVFG